MVHHWAGGEANEGGEAVHVVQELRIVGVEDVGAVLLHVDALYVLGEYVAGDVVPPVDRQRGLSYCLRLGANTAPYRPASTVR